MDLLIVGRGPSSRTFTDWDKYGDIMALSSGIYGIPKEARPPKHFCTMDRAKYFQAPIRTVPKEEPDRERTWIDEDDADWWPFWNDERIAKHVPSTQAVPGNTRILPGEVYDVVPDFAKDSFSRELLDHWHLFGFQPAWGDYSNVKGWLFDNHEPRFDDGPLGLKVANEEGGTFTLRNSWFMALQVAYRLGYRDLTFVGCDFSSPAYGCYIKYIEDICVTAQEAGLRLTTLSPASTLAEILSRTARRVGASA
jgi:hypothetical protein